MSLGCRVLFTIQEDRIGGLSLTKLLYDFGNVVCLRLEVFFCIFFYGHHKLFSKQSRHFCRICAGGSIVTLDWTGGVTGTTSVS